MKMIKQQGEVQTLVLRKAMDQQKQAAEMLLETMPQPAVSNPPHLGSNVDLYV